MDKELLPHLPQIFGYVEVFVAAIQRRGTNCGSKDSGHLGYCYRLLPDPDSQHTHPLLPAHWSRTCLSMVRQPHIAKSGARGRPKLASPLCKAIG
jgi:hypothetical protein